MIERLWLPVKLRPLDLIDFGLIAILVFWMGIIASELADLQRVGQQMQMEVRP